MSRFTLPAIVLAGFAVLMSAANDSNAQWSAGPGETVRNIFGPQTQSVQTCRGACGIECPSSCSKSIAWECAEGGGLRRVRAFTCGTHAGCRAHDDCLDRCAQKNDGGLDCATACNTEAVENFGLERALSWAAGSGPFDGQIVFEYTRDTPNAPEAAYRCPQGAERACDGGGRCVAGNETVDPVFDAYPSAGGMRVSGFRSGRVCGEDGRPAEVCEVTADIPMNGDATCDKAGAEVPCAWYGFELQYDGADPAQPLVCSSSGAADGFLGGVVADVIRAVPATEGTELGSLLGHFKKELDRGASLSDMLSGIAMTTQDGKTVGGPGAAKPAQPPGVPVKVTLESASGRLFVPMYEYRDGSIPNTVLVREVRCSHRGQPVLETTFRLRFASG